MVVQLVEPMLVVVPVEVLLAFQSVELRTVEVVSLEVAQLFSLEVR